MSSMSTTDTAASVKELGQRWWLLAVFGVITVGFGIVLTFKPGKSVHAIAMIIGIWLLILGVVQLIRAIGASGERTGFVIMGLLSIVIALILLHHTTTTVAVLGFIVGIFWTIGGVTELFHGFDADDGAINWPTGHFGAHCHDHRNPLPGLPLPVALDHLRDRRTRDDRLRYRRDSRKPSSPQSKGNLSARINSQSGSCAAICSPRVALENRALGLARAQMSEQIPYPPQVGLGSRPRVHAQPT